MSLIEVFMIGISLSMDAFAVAVCKGLNMKKINYIHTIIIALFFGGFQALMPLIGWLLGKQFQKYISSVDHWIIFALLAIIGGNMIKEGLSNEGDSCPVSSEKLDLKELTLMSVATSIDALAIGITFAFLKVSILPSIILIGCTTFTLSLIAVIIGNYFGAKYKNKAEIAGGIILILIGTKTLLQHLGFI
ncbi:manganese efflux pump MntP [Clostridium guangxiense]|uniref:manganese efflux pump MntP n=1 Tax=Clostridium guangxiense TaxID=1662055 RepID=UPI001E2AFBC2|nr:manganese efflux pump MntP family protein [Clostridium guangxiense]MCD2348013.1 manganese efflux pump MntP family protein [Clostridium guangxiense]